MGFASSAVKSLRANRALLKKRSFKEIRDDYIKFSGETEVEFKEISEFEKKKIRDKIIAQSIKDQRQEILIYALSLVLSIFLIYFVYWWVI